MDTHKFETSDEKGTIKMAQPRDTEYWSYPPGHLTVIFILLHLVTIKHIVYFIILTAAIPKCGITNYQCHFSSQASPREANALSIMKKWQTPAKPATIQHQRKFIHYKLKMNEHIFPVDDNVNVFFPMLASEVFSNFPILFDTF